MKFATALPILAALALSSPALAQMGPPPGGPGMGGHRDNPEMMAKHHAEMCANHYARAVGKLAELEVRLGLTPAQKPLFVRWREVKLAQAKSFSAKCAEFTPLGPDAPILAHRDRQIDRMEMHLADMKAETPSLDALVKALSPEQQQVLKRVAMEIIGARMEMMRGMMDRMHGAREHVIERRIETRTDAPPPAK